MRARWGDLVRTLVSLGRDPHEADFSQRSRVLGFDGEEVYVAAPNGNVQLWGRGSDSLAGVEIHGVHQLLDVDDGVTLSVDRSGTEVRLSADSGPDVIVPGGVDALLSPDGRHFRPGSPDGPIAEDRLRVVDVATGEEVSFDVRPDLVLDVFLGDSSVTFVMRPEDQDWSPEDIESGPTATQELSVLSCSLADGSCDVAAEVLGTDPVANSPVVFPG